jgi:hypothetical protein
LSIVTLVGIAIALALLLSIRRSPRAREIARPLSPADRRFIADQLEPITQLPLSTAEDEDAWDIATREMMQRLSARFPDVASVVPHELYHYISDADIHRKEPAYRAAQERYILEFIHELRADAQKT